jgi:hypothetical protein
MYGVIGGWRLWRRGVSKVIMAMKYENVNRNENGES